MVDVVEFNSAVGAPRGQTAPADGDALPSRWDEVALLIQGDDNYGVGRVAREIVRLLPGIRCVAFGRGTEHDDIVAAGVPVHVLPGGEYFRGFAPARGFVGAARQLLQARPHWRRCARELHAWCQRENVRVLHGNVWAHYLTLGALRRVHPGRYRTIWHVHNFLNLHRHFGLPGRFNCWQVRRGADFVLGVSRSVAEGWGRSGVPTRVVYNCVSSRSRHLPPARPFAQRRSGKPIRLVGAGRMEESKGHHVSVEAVGLLRDTGLAVTLDLFGGPIAGNDYLNGLRQRIRQLDLERAVTFHGYVDDFVHRLGEYDVALQARIDPEPCSMYVLECMSLALPMVASAGGGTPELARDEREGLLYPPGDAAAMARGVERLVQAPDHAIKLGRAARDRVAREFSPERFASGLGAFYAEVLRTAAQRRAAPAPAAPDDAMQQLGAG